MRINWMPILIFILATASIVQVAEPSTALAQGLDLAITSPQPGEAVQGLTQITGSISADEYSSYQLGFRFAAATSDESWFTIIRSDQLPQTEVLGEWDTSALTDENYDLRLVAFRTDGSSQNYLVENIRVRNYTPIETEAAPPQQTTIPTEIQSGIATLPIPLQNNSAETVNTDEKNPAELNAARIEKQLRIGGIIGFLFTVLIIALVISRDKNP
jgi:hypothetical protein